jgi:hypothetical protein
MHEHGFVGKNELCIKQESSIQLDESSLSTPDTDKSFADSTEIEAVFPTVRLSDSYIVPLADNIIYAALCSRSPSYAMASLN